MKPLIVLLTAATLGASAATGTPPCVGALHDLVLPEDGSEGVPTNATPFVVGSTARLVDASGDDVQVSLARITASGGESSDTTVLRVEPTADLVPGASYRVLADEREVTSFTVGDARDDVAPAVPRAVFQERFYDNCGAAQVDLEAIPDEQGRLERERTGAAFFVVVEAEDVSVGDGATWSGAAASDEDVIVQAAHTGDELRLAGVDLAGNVGEALPLDVVLPPSCASASDASPFVALVALALAGRRRR